MNNKKITMNEIISFAKEKGFVYQSSEIYGGLAGAYDFGPNGVELLKNIKDFWWKENVQKKPDYYGLDSAMFKDPRVWDASGHTSGFSDPMAECKKCNTRLRVDKELEKIGIQADEKMPIEKINKLFSENTDKIKCSKCGLSEFSEARAFNLLVKSNLGDFTSKGDSPVYLPGEACQGIYLNYKNIVDSMHPKIPFGVAQIGKAFRNEISPRNFLFRTREFEQADTQFFVRPEENVDAYEKIKKDRWKWYLDLGLSENNLRWSQHENLVFYAADAWDIEYNFPDYGFDEVEGIHDRTNYDLSVHQKASGTNLEFTENTENGVKKYIPWILETSMGLGRIFLAVLSEAYTIEKLENNDERKVLKLKYCLAPTKIAILPLTKKDGLPEIAKDIFGKLSENYTVSYSETASIGKRYRKADEVGTPFCLTVDYDSKENNTVTIRDRNTMKQDIIKIDEIEKYLGDKLK